MTKQVALSNEAYEALSRVKREGESFSQLFLRLMREANLARRDPMAFIQNPPKMRLPMEEHLRMIKENRAVDTRDAWADERARQARNRNRQGKPTDPATAES